MDVNRNVVARISHNEYKDVLLNNKCFRGSMNRIQSRNHKIKKWNLQPISLSCLDDKIYPKQWMWWISTWLLTWL